MNFDPWDQLLLLRPLVVFLVACPLLILPALIGWYAGRRQARRARNEEAERVPTVVEAADVGPDQVAAGEEPMRRYAHVVPREWDGGRPRPDRNRRSG